MLFRGLGYKHSYLWVMVLVLGTETRQGHLGLGTMSAQNPLSTDGGRWGTLVRPSEQTDSKKRRHWKALMDTFLRFSTTGFGGWTINYRWKRQAVLWFAASAYWVSTALSPQIVTKCLQMLPSTRQDEDTSLADQPWLKTADMVQSSGGSCCWERELRIVSGTFQRQERFPGTGLNGATRGTLV